MLWSDATSLLKICGGSIPCVIPVRPGKKIESCSFVLPVSKHQTALRLVSYSGCRAVRDPSMSNEPSPADVGSGLRGFVCLVGRVTQVSATAMSWTDLRPHVERTVNEGFLTGGREFSEALQKREQSEREERVGGRSEAGLPGGCSCSGSPDSMNLYPSRRAPYSGRFLNTISP